MWQRFERPCFDPEGRNSTPSLRERATEAGGPSGAACAWQPQPSQQRPGGGQQRPWHDDSGESDHTLGRSWPAPSPNVRRASAPSRILGRVL